MNEGIVGVISVAVFLVLVFAYCVAEDYFKSKAQRKYEERLSKYDTNKKTHNSM